MPLTKKGRRILLAMRRQYGPARGTHIFYALTRLRRIRNVEGR